MSKNGVLIVSDIQNGSGLKLQSYVTEMLHVALGNTLSRNVLTELGLTTYKNLVTQLIENTSDNHSDFCLNLLSLPNFTTLKYRNGEYHPFAYMDDRRLTHVNNAVRELGMELFYTIARDKPPGMYAAAIPHIDVYNIGIVYKEPFVESIL
jgi:hypothetical protein